MFAVLQRVRSASVVADGVPSGEIGFGLYILLGVEMNDTEEDALLLADKIAKIRIFSDEVGKMNLSVNDVDGECLVVSNFTLLADYSHGNRPSYFDAAPPAEADALYRYFAEVLGARIKQIATGEFGADMKIEMEADGPVTITMDSNVLKQGRR